ncbi:hypothetical protein CDAR_614521 [Caerostris darwini]|uniref:Uncharacterized protein n=1 Tax=Caerostris darwini TaxID=1538125 RepID=A0AAV4WGV1_9ARAC|nr:hypothetical protein CDAR_614521 [Caerostris darwini]
MDRDYHKHQEFRDYHILQWIQEDSGVATTFYTSDMERQQANGCRLGQEQDWQDIGCSQLRAGREFCREIFGKCPSSKEVNDQTREN